MNTAVPSPAHPSPQRAGAPAAPGASRRSLASVALAFLVGFASLAPVAHAADAKDKGFTPLFAVDGIPAGWRVRNWTDVAQDPPLGAQWVVTDGVLRGSTPRGTWLISEQEYGDFELEYEFRLGERGNGGFAFRFPPTGDPSINGFELQMVDPRHYSSNYLAEPWDLTGAIYRGLAPLEQIYLPLEWNRCSISCVGPSIVVVLNGKKVLEANLDRQTAVLPKGIPLSQRARRGRIGFQELSRAGGNVEIRKARIRVLDGR